MTNPSDVKWEQVALGDVCEVIAGQSPKSSNYNKAKDGLPFYQGKKEFTSKYLGDPTKWTTHVTSEAIAGDILMSVRAPVGPINFATERICIGRGLAAIRTGEQIDQDFLFYLLLSMQDQIKGSEGAVFASINKNQIQCISFSKPPLAEQKRIVAILDEAFVAIATATANTEKNLANAQELFDSELNSVFQHPQPAENSVSDVTAEWRETTLGETCEILDRRRKPITKRNRISGPYPYYGATGIVDYVEGYLFDEPLVLVGEDGAKWDAGENSAFAVNGRCWVNNHAHVLRPNRSVLLDNWLIYYLNQSDLTPFITGLTVPKLNQAKLCEIAIPLPPLFEQKRIATFLDKLSAEKQTLVETYKTKIHSLAELKQSLLHQAFTGELTAATKAAKSPTPAER